MSNLAILVHPGRCGSTVLGGIIGQHSKISWKGEVFTRPDLEKPTDANGNILWQDFLEDQRRQVSRPVLGVEIKTRQLLIRKIFGANLTESIENLEQASKWPVMFLKRRNHVVRLVSALEARQRSKHNFKMDDVPEDVRVRVENTVTDTAYGIDNCPISEWLEKVEGIEQQLETEIRGRGGLVLEYEDHIADNPFDGASAIIRHIQQQPADAKVIHKRINPKKLSDRIENFSELESWLTPQQFARYGMPETN